MIASARCILAAVAALLLALTIGACSPPPSWGVVLLVPERVAIASDPEPAYQLRHVAVRYATRAACVAEWGEERCVQSLSN